MNINIELPKFGESYCEKCGYQKERDTPPSSYAHYCPVCNPDQKQGGQTLWRGRKPLPFPTVQWDHEPRSYNLCDSRDKEIQIGFRLPRYETPTIWVTCGIVDVSDLEDQGFVEGGRDVVGVLAYVVDKVRGYLYHGQKPKLEAALLWLEKHPSWPEWKKNRLITEIEAKAAEVYKKAGELYDLQEELGEEP